MGVFPTAFEDSDLSGLPNADPGNGLPYELYGVICAGAFGLDARYSAIGHTHDDRYFTESEVTAALAGKADKATTLAGYGITDALATSVGAATQVYVGSGPLNRGAVIADTGSSVNIYLNGALRFAPIGGDSGGTSDTAISRSSAGVLEVNSGTLGDYRDFKAGNVSIAGGKSLTVGSVADASFTLQMAADSANPAVDALYIAPTAPSRRVFFGGSGKSVYALNLSNVTNIEGCPAILFTDSLMIGSGVASVGITREPSPSDAIAYAVGSPNTGGHKFYTGGTYNGYTSQTLQVEFKKNGNAEFYRMVALGPYTFGTLPSASANSGKSLRITDRGQKQAYSDGTNWLFVHDNSVVV